MESTIKKLKIRLINGKEYKYLEYEKDGKVSTTDYYVEFKVDDSFKETLKGIGGMPYKLLVQPIEDEEKEVSILKVMFYLMEGMVLVTLVKHEDGNGNVLEYRYSTSHMFYKYMENFVEEREEYVLKEDTTFKYLEDEYIKKLGVDIYQPKSSEDTGYTLDNKVMEYNKEYIINNMENIKNEQLKERINKIYSGFNIEYAKLKMNNMESVFGVVGEITFIKKDGSAVSWLEYYYLGDSEFGKITFKEFIQLEEVSELKYTAENINKSLDRVRMRGDEEDKTNQEIANRLYEINKGGLEYRLETDVYELLKKDYKELASKDYLELLLEEDCLEIKAVE